MINARDLIRAEKKVERLALFLRLKRKEEAYRQLAQQKSGEELAGVAYDRT